MSILNFLRKDYNEFIIMLSIVVVNCFVEGNSFFSKDIHFCCTN